MAEPGVRVAPSLTLLNSTTVLNRNLAFNLQVRRLEPARVKFNMYFEPFRQHNHYSL